MTARIDTTSVAAARSATRRGWLRALGLAAIAAVGGLGVGRFLAYDGGDGAGPITAAVPAAVTPEAEMEQLRQAVASSPQDPQAWQALGSAYVRGAIATGDPELFGLAEDALDRATELDPTSAATMVARGTLALTVHHFDEALRLGEAAVAADPFNAEAFAVIVDAQVELGLYDEAAATLDQLLALRPNLASLSRASYLRQLSGDLDGSLTAMQQAESAGPGRGFDAALVTSLRGDVHLLRGEVDRAGEAYTAALDQVPGLVAGVVGRARVLEASGERAQAIDLLTAASAKLQHPAVATMLGELLIEDGRAAEANEPLSLARQLYKGEVEAGASVELEVAVFEADHGAPQVALDAAERAYATRHTVYTADTLAWALHRAGRSDEALRYVDEALQLGTMDPALRVHTASILLAAGQDQRARKVLAPAVERGGWLPLPRRPDAERLTSRLQLELPRLWSA